MLGARGDRQESETLLCVAFAANARGARLSGVERNSCSDQPEVGSDAGGCSSSAAGPTSYAFASSSARKRGAAGARGRLKPVERTHNWYIELGSRSMISADVAVEFLYW